MCYMASNGICQSIVLSMVDRMFRRLFKPFATVHSPHTRLDYPPSEVILPHARRPSDRPPSARPCTQG